MGKWIGRLIRKPRDHEHQFKTTHVNCWGHPMSQKCSCGVTRDFSFFDNYEDMDCMPWDKGRWVHSDGEESVYQTYCED